MRLSRFFFYSTVGCLLVLLYIAHRFQNGVTLRVNTELKQPPVVQTENRPESPTKRKTYRPKLTPIKIKGVDAFVYSVVLMDSSEKAKTRSFRIHATEKEKTHPALICCFHGDDGTVLESNYSRLVDIFPLGTYQSSVSSCEAELPSASISFLTIRQECANVGARTRDAIRFTESEQPAGDMAICVHAVYGYVDPEQIVEWMEIIWLQGVRRVFVYPLMDVDKVDARTLRVFQYYETKGLVQIIPYVLAISPRGQGLNLKRFRANARSHQMFSDEFVPIFDCFSRTHKYKYTAIMDFDEIIVNPIQPLNLIPTLNILLHRNPTAAYFRFNVENFVKNWTDTIDRSKPIFMQYVTRTNAMHDRVKNVFVYRRVASINMHSAVPSRGYRMVHVPKELATIHHYTNCRYGWSPLYCLRELERHKDESLLKIESLVYQRLQNVPASVREGRTD